VSTRFESSSLSKVLDDEAVAKASEKFVRLLVRRPHAYEFLQKYNGKKVPIPGIILLDPDGKLVGSSPLESAKELADKLSGLANTLLLPR
jgi:hypothetical protein